MHNIVAAPDIFGALWLRVKDDIAFVLSVFTLNCNTAFCLLFL